MLTFRSPGQINSFVRRGEESTLYLHVIIKVVSFCRIVPPPSPTLFISILLFRFFFYCAINKRRRSFNYVPGEGLAQVSAKGKLLCRIRRILCVFVCSCLRRWRTTERPTGPSARHPVRLLKSRATIRQAFLGFMRRFRAERSKARTRPLAGLANRQRY